MPPKASSSTPSMYCLKCKKKTATGPTTKASTTNHRHLLKGKCAVCGTKKAQFTK